MSAGTHGLTDVLTQIAALAVRAIPGADGAGLTLLRIDRADMIVKSEPFVRAIDDIQYGLGEGLCISAAATAKTRRSGQLGNDSRWPQFGPRASGLGVHSALSLPLVISTGALGAMNICAHDPNSFDDHSQNCVDIRHLSGSGRAECADPRPDRQNHRTPAGRPRRTRDHRPGGRSAAPTHR